MKAVVAAFNQEEALVGAFSVLTNLRMELFQALLNMYDYNIHSAMFLRSEFASLLEDCKRIDSYKLAAIEPNKAANMSKFRSNPHTTSSKLFNKCVTVISYDSSKNIY